MQEKARGQYEEHYALIERLMPAERLLKFNLEDRWEPLCKFLNKSIPDVEFPGINESVSLRRKLA